MSDADENAPASVTAESDSSEATPENASEATQEGLWRLEVPTLAGSRLSAQQLLARLPSTLKHNVVQLYCAPLIAATPSFADELVRTVLVKRHAVQLDVMDVSNVEFIGYLNDRAEAYGVGSKLSVHAVDPQHYSIS